MRCLCVFPLTRDHQDLGLDMEGAGDHEQAPGVGVEPPGGGVHVPALAVAGLAVQSHLQLGPLVKLPLDNHPEKGSKEVFSRNIPHLSPKLPTTNMSMSTHHIISCFLVTTLYPLQRRYLLT